MAYQPAQPVHWRGQLSAWLQGVTADAQLFGGDLRTAVNRHTHSFPKHKPYAFIRQWIARGVAKWLLRAALQEAAQAANLNVSPEAIDLIADLAVGLL